MSDKGIVFSAAMVRALLAGRKTQTRRLLTLRGHRQFSEFGPSNTHGYDWHFRRGDACWCDFRAADLPLPYATGDRLYVREAWRVSPDACEGWHPEHPKGWIDYQAGGSLELVAPSFEAAVKATFLKTEDHDWDFVPSRYRPCIHMPRWTSRLWLHVTHVRVQRLGHMSESDAIAEGVFNERGEGWTADGSDWFASPKIAFHNFWDRLHTVEGTTWETSPWVVALTFDVHQGNIDSHS